MTTGRAADAIAHVMRRHPLILTLPRLSPDSVRDQYLRSHPRTEWERMIEVLRDHGESGSLDAFDRPTLYALNMAVMSRDLFDQYVSWLFPILLDFHRGADYSTLSAYQKRSPGLVAERLLTLFTVSHGLDAAAPKMRVIQFDD